MGIIKKSTKKKEPKIEENPNLKKLSIFITIVNAGHGNAICKVFQRFEVAAQFTQRGRGTASKDILGILGLEETGKDVVFSIIKEENIPEVKPELEAYFKASKANKGIGMAIPMTSIIGATLYKFLTNTI